MDLKDSDTCDHVNVRRCRSISSLYSPSRSTGKLTIAYLHGKTNLTLNVKVQHRICIIDSDADNNSVECRYTMLSMSVVAGLALFDLALLFDL